MRVKYLAPVILGVVVAVVVTLSLSSGSRTAAFGSFLDAFNTKYGTSGTRLDTCGTCHISPQGGGPKNGYGNAIADEVDNGASIEDALTNVEPLDSDGDSFSNIAEINARTFPGDPNDFPQATPTPTPPPPTVTPTPTPPPGGLTQGDVDCNGSVNAVDALKVLRKVAGLTVSQEPSCPPIGSNVASLFGDVDCSGAVNSVDALKILRKVAGLSVAQGEGCALIGDPL